jgi:Uma2 family endonuclease
MIVTQPRFASFEDYLAADPSELPEGRFEYWDGELVGVMTESLGNVTIANYLLILLMQSGIPVPLIQPHACELEVSGRPRSRFPDLVVLDEAHLSLLKSRLTITLDMPPPVLVVEVVSPGKKNRDRDFIAKRRQYADRGIPEYWLLDPENGCITVLSLVTIGTYHELGIFKADQSIDSRVFPELKLQADQILKAGRSLI